MPVDGNYLPRQHLYYVALDQLVQVDGDGRRTWGWVSGFTLPLTADSDMRVDTETVWTEG